jgi:hypothetical protein
MKTMAEGELHDGGSTSFTVVFLHKMDAGRLNILMDGYKFERSVRAIS